MRHCIPFTISLTTMLTTKFLVHDVHDVPVVWIFEHYARLPYKLSGQDVKISSLFNNRDRNPSMFIYLDKVRNVYKFKDFSTGKQGSAIDLVKELHNEEFFKASQRIINDYNDYVLHNNGGYDVDEFKQHSKYQVCSYNSRPWNTRDQYYWTQFNIGSRLLEMYNVRPLSDYTMCKKEEEGDKYLEISAHYLYGYFDDKGELYKIYQPKVKEKKFIKVGSYLQGYDQLTGQTNLMIVSSLKDLMSIKSLKIPGYDYVAPDSENSMVAKHFMEEFFRNYSNVHVLLDNDEAGRKAMDRYVKQYDVTAFSLEMSKDIADSVKEFGPKAVRLELISLTQPADELALQI